MIFFKIILVCLIVESYRESCHSEQGMRFELLSEDKVQGTHIIGHAHGNDNIAKHTPNDPHLGVVSLDNWE